MTHCDCDENSEGIIGRSARVLYEAKLVGGNLALDFVNTSTGRNVTSKWVDYLADAFDILVWLRFAKAIDESQLREMIPAIAINDETAKSFLKSALHLRNALSGTFRALITGVRPADGDLSTLNKVLAAAHDSERLVWTPEGMKAGRSLSNQRTLEDTLWPIALAAEDLLTTANQLRRVKICGSPTCEWLFLDTSKNGSRNWCQMEVCGNREKGRRRLKREREDPPSATTSI